MSSAAARMTYAAAKQYAIDRLQDGTTNKALRQSGRVVKNALKRIAKVRTWGWYQRKLRLVVHAPRPYVGLSVAALGVSVGKAASTNKFSAALRDASLLLSGHTELMRVKSVANSVLLTLWSSEPFVGASVGVSFAGAGKFLFERVPLPRTFRSPVTPEPQQSNYITGLQRIGIDEMVALKRRWDNQPSDPIFYCFLQNDEAVDTGDPRYELWLWPPPSTLKTIELIANLWPEVPSDDGDLIDWDPQHEDLFLRAMDVEAAIELESNEKYQRAEPHWRRAIREAKATQRITNTPPCGYQPPLGSKQYRSDGFVDVP